MSISWALVASENPSPLYIVEASLKTCSVGRTTLRTENTFVHAHVALALPTQFCLALKGYRFSWLLALTEKPRRKTNSGSKVRSGRWCATARPDPASGITSIGPRDPTGDIAKHFEKNVQTGKMTCMTRCGGYCADVQCCSV